MSRIFDALQRSGKEQTGVEYPDVPSMATEVFDASQGQKPADPTIADQVLTFQEPGVLAGIAENPAPVAHVAETPIPEKSHDIPGGFPSLEVHVSPSSRLVFFTEPDSMAAEKFRFLGVRLRHLRQNRPLKKVLVTSTIQEEGKTLVSANLAGVLARRREKVLLLEGDLRRPALTQQFGLGRLAGLGEWLQSGVQTVSNVYHLGGPGFWLMPAGHPPANPLELMQSGRLSQLMGQLVRLFDWIIVDSPPLLTLGDTTVWARLTDGTVFVAREGKTEKAPLQRGLETLKKSELLGIVLNGCSDSAHKNYYQRYSNSANEITSPVQPVSNQDLANHSG
jgi:capsular exopolysaccharide synthesis family protein